jgi:hypothetical protein
MTERLTLTRGADGKPALDEVVLNRYRDANGANGTLRVAEEVRLAADEALNAKVRELHRVSGKDYVECAREVARENPGLLMLSRASVLPETAGELDVTVEDSE